MSGKKQHYIPQALLRGFLADHKGKRGQAWVYKSGKSPYPSSILDIAAERYFYSDLGQGTLKTLDDRITDYENRLGRLLNSLRNAADGQLVDPLVSAEVVAHLSFRGAYLREMFSSGVHQLIEGASSSLNDLEIARSILGVDEHGNTSLLTNSIDGELNKIKDQLPSGLPVPLIRRILLHSVREDFGDLYGQVLPSIGTAFRQLVSEIPTVIRDGHAKALDSGMAPDKRVSDLANLSWHVYQSRTALVLPDCVAISIDKDQTTAQPYLLGSVENIAAIMLPITSGQMLVGCPLDITGTYTASDFNPYAAKCSTVFFVSSENTEELHALAESIGSVTYRTISALVAESLDSAYRRTDSPASTEKGQASTGGESTGAHNRSQIAQTPSLISYQVSFKGCATQEQAEAIAKAVGVVVNNLVSYLELDCLESVIFAEDYATALEDLHNELTPLTDLETTCADGLIGVATTITVVRDGESKSYVVMKSWLGHAFISGADQEVQVASHVLSAMLSQIAFSELLRSALQEAEAEPAYSPWESLLFGPMNSAPAGYFSAWMSAEVDPAAGDSYRKVVLKMLEHANTLISMERLSYATHEDLDRFLYTATDALGGLLISIAKLLGHCDACNESIYGEDDELNRALTHQGLCGWISLYGRDLRRVFASRGRWRSIKELSSLGVHMERQLWRYFVFPWIMEDGQIRVEVPYLGDHRFE